ncbi:hypothetical protein ANME2D_00713 [Candidatus Methanoperedens nitroreducens]|uniref:Uncharacterized protein n=1 Tax=Candidatus Methanoperedens nitratireducens TaxID=1392998 RepID=A0A062V3H6_9EURY|nr:hypothetical protein [Candidatus Methanoperedens nitroreducens]KCZ73641.1 hypothetical protein ANME2D_00713 [Candidatus Methanoperedens nitroreducens]
MHPNCNPNSDQSCDHNPAKKRGRGRPKGLIRVSRSTHGGFTKDPMRLLDFWKKNKPDVAKFVEDVSESFRRQLDWEPTDPRMTELLFLSIQIASRNLMTDTAAAADFKRAVKDSKTGAVVRWRAHHLLTPILKFDVRIHEKLKNFGLYAEQGPRYNMEDLYKLLKSKNIEGDDTFMKILAIMATKMSDREPAEE